VLGVGSVDTDARRGCRINGCGVSVGIGCGAGGHEIGGREC